MKQLIEFSQYTFAWTKSLFKKSPLDIDGMAFVYFSQDMILVITQSGRGAWNAKKKPLHNRHEQVFIESFVMRPH